MNGWLSAPDWEALALSLKLGACSTALLLLLGVPLAHHLAHARYRGSTALQVLVASPLVLPPTVLGFYLLQLFSPRHPPGSWWQALTGESLAFSFTGLVVASVIYSLPFVVQPAQASFAQQPARYREAALLLGLGPWARFLRISVPMARSGILAGACLGFAHTLGEFGVILMIGGNLPGETRVAAIAVFEHVEQFDYEAAHRLSLTLIAIAALLLTVSQLNRPAGRPGWRG